LADSPAVVVASAAEELAAAGNEMNLLSNLSDGISFFNDHDFFQAHDSFEDIWRECEQVERLFFQGMVQISVGCFHYISGNFSGALSQLRKGSEKLKNYLPIHRKIDLKSLIIDLNVLILELENDFNRNKKNIKIEKIPKIITIV